MKTFAMAVRKGKDIRRIVRPGARGPHREGSDRSGFVQTALSLFDVQVLLDAPRHIQRTRSLHK